jgi:hypothetical protein
MKPFIRKRSSKSHVTEINKGIEFLRKKGAFAEDKEFAELMYARLQDPNALDSPHLITHYERSRERLLALMHVKEDKHFDAPREDTGVEGGIATHLFTHLEFEGYEEKNVFFLDHPNTLAQRFQNQGLCYMQASTVVQHYAVSQGLSGTIPMLDITKYIKNNFTPKQLEKYVFDDVGDDSALFLENILQRNSIIINGGEQYDEMYLKYGPGLVSRFRVHEDFAQVDIHQHHGKPAGTKNLGFHSMALVGFRNDHRTKKKYYLLQNWWEEKQFVEVDEEYLKYSGAIVYFIETPQTKIPEHFATNYASYFSLDNIDKAEGPWKERSYVE